MFHCLKTAESQVDTAHSSRETLTKDSYSSLFVALTKKQHFADLYLILCSLQQRGVFSGPELKIPLKTNMALARLECEGGMRRVNSL